MLILKNLIEVKQKYSKKTLYSVFPLIYGISFFLTKKVYVKLFLDKNYKIEFLDYYDLELIKEFFDPFVDLERDENVKLNILLNIDFLKKLKNYRGMRHILSLPVRGQRTHTNGKTMRKKFLKKKKKKKIIIFYASLFKKK